MANPRNFRNLFVKIAHKVDFFVLKRQKQLQFSNLLEIFHREPDSLFCNVQRFDLDADVIADGKHFRGVLDELL